jgi:hypothetical protein
MRLGEREEIARLRESNFHLEENFFWMEEEEGVEA